MSGLPGGIPGSAGRGAAHGLCGITSLRVLAGNTPSLFFINVKRHFQPRRGQTALPSGLMLRY